MVYLIDDYLYVRENRAPAHLSRSSLRNHWKALRSYFSWAQSRKHIKDNPTALLECPEESEAVIDPLTENEIKRLLAAAAEPTLCKPGNRKPFMMTRRTALRDVPLIGVLLETGIRAGELCRLNKGDVNLESSTIHVAAYGSNRKTKERIIPITVRTMDALNYYMDMERSNAGDLEPLFLPTRGERLTSDAVRSLFAELGTKAEIKHLHPHRLRHTFATQFLRNGGGELSLQEILGHSDLNMVKRYAQIAEADIAVAQKKFSPVVGWDLQYPIVDQKGRKNSTKKGNTKRKTEKAAPAPKIMSSNHPSKTQDGRQAVKSAQKTIPLSSVQQR